MSELKLAQADLLENDKGKLKEELRSLSEEVHGLKKMIEQKNQAKFSGEPFEPPKQEQSDAANEQIVPK